MESSGLVGIYISPEAGKPLTPVGEIRAVAGRGLVGDRYFQGEGTFSKKAGPDREVTLIEIEALEALRRDYQVEIEPGAARRNLVTRGVALNHLVGREFIVGAARLRGIRLCEPCEHLEKLTQAGVRKGLVHRGGLRAQVLADGLVRVGDPVQLA
jgi:MOSC domain-containing protein YiiM